MDGVCMLPVVISRKGDQPGDDPHPIVGPLRLEIRPVPAAMEDDEGPRHEIAVRMHSGTVSHSEISMLRSAR
jgi:hypothetical protein